MSEKYKTTESIVAFIDVLGSTDAIMRNADKSLRMMHNAYSEAIKLFQSLFDKSKRIKPCVKIFSDNIVVSVSREGESGHGAFHAITMISAIIQVQFLKHGLLTRGGIASGSFFVDDMMVWGTALVKAHSLENSLALYPRIIVDPDLIGDLNLATSNCTFVRCKEWIEQDIDGFFMIDYLNKYLLNKEIFIIQMMSIAEAKIIKYNEENKKKACQKWLWFTNYVKDKLLTDDEDSVSKSDLH